MKQARVVRGIVLAGAGTLPNMVFGFLSMTLAARIISEQALGIYFLLLTIVYLLEIVGNMGLRLSAAKFIASAPDDAERARITNNLLTFRLVTILLVCAGAMLMRPVFLHFFGSGLLSTVFMYAPLLFAAQLTEGTLSYMMQGFHLYERMALVQAFQGVLNFVLVALLVIGLHLDIAGLLLASTIALTVSSVIRLHMIPTPKALAWDWDQVRAILRFGAPLQGNDVMTFIFQRIDVLILGAYMSPTHIAYLEVANKIPTYFQRLSQAIQSVYFPHLADLFARGRRTEAEHILDNALRLSSFGTMFAALVTLLFHREIIVLLFSEKYLPSGWPLGVLMAVFGISMASQLIDSTLISGGHPGYILVINAVTTVVTIVASLTMVPRWGVTGAVLSRLLANLFTHPVAVWCLYREGIKVRVARYIKPAILLVLALLIARLAHADGLIARASIVVAFVAISLALSIIRVQDVAGILSSLASRQTRKAVHSE